MDSYMLHGKFEKIQTVTTWEFESYFFSQSSPAQLTKFLGNFFFLHITYRAWSCFGNLHILGNDEWHMHTNNSCYPNGQVCQWKFSVSTDLFRNFSRFRKYTQLLTRQIMSLLCHATVYSAECFNRRKFVNKFIMVQSLIQWK